MINAKNATYFFENIKINDSYRNRILVFYNTPYDLMRTPTTLKWSANHLCKRTSYPRLITYQPLPERKLWQSSNAPMLDSLTTVTISPTSKNCSALTGL